MDSIFFFFYSIILSADCVLFMTWYDVVVTCVCCSSWISRLILLSGYERPLQKKKTICVCIYVCIHMFCYSCCLAHQRFLTSLSIRLVRFSLVDYLLLFGVFSSSSFSLSLFLRILISSIRWVFFSRWSHDSLFSVMAESYAISENNKTITIYNIVNKRDTNTI